MNKTVLDAGTLSVAHCAPYATDRVKLASWRKSYKNNKLISDENNPDKSCQVCRTDKTGDRAMKGITNHTIGNETENN